MEKSTVNIIMSNSTVEIDGTEYQKPGSGYDWKIKNGDIYINGYLFKDGRFYQPHNVILSKVYLKIIEFLDNLQEKLKWH